MDFFELISKRESCRNFSDKPVEDEKLKKLVEAACIAPSACNSQPWSFICVTQPETREKLAQCAQDLGMNKFASDAACLTVVVEEFAKLSEKILTRFNSQDYASIDIGISTAHYCLAATELGLSTCILGWFNENNVKKLLNIPSSKHVRLIIATGYAATNELRPKKRKERESMVQYIK